MSWPQWPGSNVSQPGIVQPPVLNPAPNVVNPATNQYTPEQWAQMQHQNWQQWAQWQQQFQQWQQQYGAEYQKSMNAIAQASAPVQPPFMPVPPLPAEAKPPPPPEEPSGPPVQPTSATFSMNVPPPSTQSNYSTAPPPQPPNANQGGFDKFSAYRNNPPPNQGAFSNQDNQQKLSRNQNFNTREPPPGQNMNWQNPNPQGMNRFSQPPPPRGVPQFDNKTEFGLKRPFMNPNDNENVKRNKVDFNEGNKWDGNQQKPRWDDTQKPLLQQKPPQRDNVPSTQTKANPEELSEAEKKFDKQFNDWEAQFQKWKEQNANHPDKEQYRQYEKKWETWRAQLLERREQMKRKRLGLTDNSSQLSADKSSPNKLVQEKQTKNAPPSQAPAKFPSAETPINKNQDNVTLPIASKPDATETDLTSNTIGLTRPPPNLNNQPLEFKNSGLNVVESSEKKLETNEESVKPDEQQADFLKSSASEGIPGLDLVKETDGQQDEESSDKKPENTKPDLEAISRGINSILGDQKLMNMLSLVSQNQNKPPARVDSPKFSPAEYNQEENEYSDDGQGESFKFDKPMSNTYDEPPGDLNKSFNTQSREDDSYNEEGSNSFGDSSHFNRSSDNFNRNTGPFNSGDSGNLDKQQFNRSSDNFNRNTGPLNSGDSGNLDKQQFNRSSDSFNRNTGPLNSGDSGNFDKQQFNRNQNFMKDPTNFDRGANNFNRGSMNTNFDNFNTGSGNFDRNFDNVDQNSRDFDNFSRAPNNFNKGPPNFNKDRNSQNFNRESNQFGRGSDNFDKKLDDFNSQTDNYSRGQDNFNRGPDNFNRGPDNFNRGPDSFNRALDNFNRGPDNFNRGPGNFNRGPDNFNRGPDSFNRSQDSFNRGPNNFNRGYDNFNKGPDNFNRGPDNFNRGPDNFNRGPDNFNRGSDNFNRGPDNFNKGLENLNRGTDNFNNRGFDNMGRGPGNFNRGPNNFTRETRTFDTDNENFNRGPDNSNRGFDNSNRNFEDINKSFNFDKGSGNVNRNFNPNRDSDDYDSGQNMNRGSRNFDKDDLNFNRERETFGRNLSFDKGPVNIEKNFDDNFSRGPNSFNKPPDRPSSQFSRGSGDRGSFEDFNKGSTRSPGSFDVANNRFMGDSNKFNKRTEFSQGSEDFKPNDQFNSRRDVFDSNTANRNVDRFAQEEMEFNRNKNNVSRNQNTFDDTACRTEERGPGSFKRKSEDLNIEPKRLQSSETRFGLQHNRVNERDIPVGDSLQPRFMEKQNLEDFQSNNAPATRIGSVPSELTPDRVKSCPDESDGIWKTNNVIDYGHKSKLDEPEIILELFHTFDYRHKPFNRIPYPSRPRWLSEMVNKYPEFDVAITRSIRSDHRKYNERFEDYSQYEDRGRKSYEDRNRRSYDDRDKGLDRDRKFPEDRNRKLHDDKERRSYDDKERRIDDGKGRRNHEDKQRRIYSDRDWAEEKDNTYENKGKTFERSSRGFDESRHVDSKASISKFDDFENEESFISDEKRKEKLNFGDDKQNKGKSTTAKTMNTSAAKSNVTLIDDILSPPGRYNRPPRIVIILRGPPGSGKSFLAKLIKDKEVENGGSAPRILCLDDYFMVEQEKEVEEDGRKTKVKEMVYEFEEGMEASYRQSLMKSFKKTITDGYFNFIIVDNINDKVKYFGEMWSFAKQNGFQVYISQMELDVQICTKRNVHGRTEAEIEKCVAGWEPTPSHHPILDSTSLIQSGSIPEVEMEEINSPSSDNMTEEDRLISSKWDSFDYSIDNLAKLDGTNKPLRTSRTMEDYLQLEDDWVQPVSTKPGQKRVRWADLEERKEQEKMRAIGFVVGHTNWDRMMDPTMGGSALTQTKYIERYRKY